MLTRLLNRLAMLLASWSGDDGRTSELQNHLIEARASGQPVGLADVGSLSILVGRRAVRDIPWWLAGLPVALISLLLVATTYSEHFWAWDVVGPDEHPRTQATQIWILVTNAIGIFGVLAGLGAGRVAVQQLRHGRPFGPLVLVGVLLVGFSQANLFIERTAPFRDGRLKAEHVNEVSGYSLALFAGLSLIPAVYLIATVVLNKTLRDKTLRNKTHGPKSIDVQGEGRELDPIALAAVGFPLLIVFAGPISLLLAVVFVWVAKSFSTKLKVVATLVLVAPLAGALFWLTVASAPGIDDGHPAVIFGVLGAFVVVWLWMAVVAFRPLRGMRLQVAVEHQR